MTQERIEREAAAWFARLRGSEGDEQRAAFTRWRDADPRHGKAYAQYETLWAATGALRRPREIRQALRAERRIDVVAALRRAQDAGTVCGKRHDDRIGP